ncbi:PBS lyase HEAT-like repeat protein [Xenococcus sp. PCC 7305]|uniref:HEAT repeat domain-containing protein n=1 Tax=Xenococcus sp. PCC 7305 TaxID=102125 RepID=UPI0002AC4075|nr:HEAT repeat domain-containing protein [Xenococcus sp. PCC 7305]ELS02315.1 PBS lyase HEAT-like repeat protein [Xenococcus sp. PCC 7305]
MISIEKLIEHVNKADSADALLDAVENLADAKSELAIPTLIEVLGFNNPGAAVAAVEGLIKIGESAVPQLLENLDTYNYGARAWMIRAFAGIGDPAALDLLLKAAVTDFSQSVRRAAARGLGIINWSKVAPEKVAIAQEQALQTLFLATEDGEWIVRYAAITGLHSLGNETPEKFLTAIANKLREILTQEPEIVVKARIQLALEQLG